MSTTDELLSANRAFADAYDQASFARAPARKLAVVACMDARLNVEKALGLKLGDAHVIRNAGGIVTDDVLRSLIISHHLTGTQEFVIINHTDCGMTSFEENELRERLQRSTGVTASVPAGFHAFADLETNVRQQMHAVRSHPWLPKTIAVRGFIYDVRTGRLRDVAP